MKQAPIPQNDRERLEALEDYEILAAASEPWFDHIVTVASRLCETPIALVSVVGRDEQLFKASQGLPEELNSGSRENSFCGHALLEPGIFEIPDTLADDRFHDNPWVTEESGIRFYAGARLLNDAGFALGTICVLDHRPRHLSAAQKEALQSLASVVMAHIEVQRSETFGRHLQRVVETSDHFVAILDAVDFHVLHVNERLETLLSGNDEAPDLRSLPIEEVFPALDMTLLRELADQDLETASPTDLVSVPMFGADRKDYVVRLRVTLSQVRERRVLILMAEDMEPLLTSLHQADRAASEVRRLALVARLTDNPVIITDAGGCIEWVNPSFERLTGYSLDEVIGRSPGAFLQGPDTDEGARRRIAIAIQSGEPVREEILNYHRDGSSYWLDLDIQPVYDEQNALVSYVAVQTDITRRKEMEDNLRRARDEAEASNQAKSQFLANISHELRTPLNGIVGITDLLDQNPNRSDLRTQLATLRDSAKGLMEIINDLLDLSKIQAQSLDLELRSFDLRGLIHNLENLFRPQVEQKGVNLAVSIGDGVPRHVWGDSLRLKQVLMNLLSNALKFTDQGSVELTITHDGDSGEALNLTFSVKDSGAGIDEDAQSRIFEPFGQEDTSMARRYGGTGLGLTISQRLVALMGGALELSSSKGKGACFYFTLPFQPVAPEYHETSSAPEIRVEHETSVHAVRVLLVDDNSVNRQVEAAMVEELGGTVACYQTGEEAIRAFEHAHFDLVLLDIQMPDMNGYEVAARLRECESDRGDRTPIIAVTGHNMRDPDADPQQRIDAFIIKPLTLSELRGSIERFLGKLEPLTDQAPQTSAGKYTPDAPDDSLIDGTLLSQKLNGNPKLIVRLQELFERQHHVYIERMDEALANGDSQSLADAAHSLKGSVGYFNQGQLWQEVAELEKAARSGEAELAERVARVRSWVLQLADALRSFTPEQS